MSRPRIEITGRFRAGRIVVDAGPVPPSKSPLPVGSMGVRVHVGESMRLLLSVQEANDLAALLGRATERVKQRGGALTAMIQVRVKSPVIEGTSQYWANRAHYLRLWLARCEDRAAAARLEAQLQEAEEMEEQSGGLRLYVVRRTAARKGGRRRGVASERQSTAG